MTNESLLSTRLGVLFCRGSTLDLSVDKWILLKKVLPRKLSRHHLKKMMSSPGQEEVNLVEEDQEEEDPLVKRRKVEVSVSFF